VVAIILAAAGLDRLEKTEWVRERLAPELMCPAAGQGALGIEIRAGDQRMMEAVAFLDDSSTRFAVTAERFALAALGGGCQVPIGVYCRAVDGGQFEILGVVADPDGSRVLRSRALGVSAQDLGRAVAVDLLQQGASELFEGIGTH
jgi:hydroxymethylbilane synthase